MRSSTRTIMFLVASLGTPALAHDGGGATDHLNIGFYYGHDGSFEAPADPASPATLLVDTHPWELGGVYFKLDEVSNTLLDGRQTTLPGFDTLPPDEQEFGGHGYFSWMDPAQGVDQPAVMLHIDEIDPRLVVLSPFTLEPLVSPAYLGTDFHLHAVFFVDRAGAIGEDEVLSATFHLSDLNGHFADSETFTLQFTRTPPACLADLDGNGILNVDDVAAFITELPDVNGDTVFNVDDVQAFIDSFAAGCP